MSEFSLIQKFCRDIGVSHSETQLSIGDDAAVIQIPSGMECAVCVDTMVEGVHFLNDVSAEALGHKILAVNLSDLAAMGALPKWATLALTLPSKDEQWLQAFRQGLHQLATEHGVQLIGGDTTQGPLTLSLQIIGLLPQGSRLTRSGAEIGDDIYVSNTLGDAALALAIMQDRVKTPADESLLDSLRRSLERPEPQCELGVALLDIANACIDLSDGLVGDLAHIASQSQVTMRVDVDQIPLSKPFKTLMAGAASKGDVILIDFALTGGDDYQLAFTANPSRRAEIVDLAKRMSIRLSRIGVVLDQNAQQSKVELHQSGSPIEPSQGSSYQHFQ